MEVQRDELKVGHLYFWWIPQLGTKAFYYEIESFEQGNLLLDAFAMYDLFQLKNNIKGDYANAGGLGIGEIWEDEDGTQTVEISDVTQDDLEEAKEFGVDIHTYMGIPKPENKEEITNSKSSI